jgi:hypothetical protein
MIHKIFLFLIIFIICSYKSFAKQDFEEPTSQINFAFFKIGEERTKINLNDFEIKKEFLNQNCLVEANFVEDSIVWFRIQQNLVLPKARVQLKVQNCFENLYFEYKDQKVFFQNEVVFFVSLFELDKVYIYSEFQRIAVLSFILKENKTYIFIDHSCFPYGLEVSGFEGNGLLVGCVLKRVGKRHYETPFLEVTWLSPSLSLENQSSSFYNKIIFTESKVVSFDLLNKNKEKHKVNFKVKIPSKMHRLKTALGFGPYELRTQMSENNLTKLITPSFMLYANYWIDDELSIRAFDALVSNNPVRLKVFNNFGLYFAYELNRVLDKRIQLIALLGFQGVTNSTQGFSTNSFTQLIFPQGFEFSYFNAFGAKNYIFNGGIFLLPSSTNPYVNSWLRFGKKIFVEVNYIDWQLYERKARMFGLSFGIPFLNFL